MLLIFGIAGVAALTVTAYIRLRSRSPETAAATTRAVRELAAVILVCTRAIEGVVDALRATAPQRSYTNFALLRGRRRYGTPTTTTNSSRNHDPPASARCTRTDR